MQSVKATIASLIFYLALVNGPSATAAKTTRLSQQAYQNAARLMGKPETLDIALKEINKAISYCPDVAAYYAMKGTILNSKDECAEALAAANKGLTCEKTLELLFVKANALLGLNRPKEALQAAGEVRGVYLYLIRGRAYLQLQQPGKARKEFDSALQLMPKNLDLRMCRVRAYLALHDWSEVLSDTNILLASLAKGKTSLTAHLARAQALAETGARQQAIAEYKLTIATYPDAPEAHTGLLALYERLKMTKEATAERTIIDELSEEFAPPKNLGR